MNASIYIWKRDKLLKSKNLLQKVFQFMKCLKKNHVDIDTKLDLRINEILIKKLMFKLICQK